MKMLELPLLLVLLSISAVIGCSQKKELSVDWFTGKDALLERAIDADDVSQLRAALTAGASANAKGRLAVNPLEYALGHSKKAAYMELLHQHADPNQRDKEGDNAVTLAARMFAKDSDYLILAIKAGGDPNTRRSDGDPILAGFKAAHNIEAIKALGHLGADVNVRRRNGSPLIVDAALTQDWDVVWCFLELGAKYDYRGEPFTIEDGFRNSAATPPDSPLYRYKVATWKFLSERGVALSHEFIPK